ncbi:MAG: Na+/H+ antiporter subunit E [Chromatiales bacterium]|nr:Na+/H+ antiporter subunit E [Chromatiales bacterium]
MKHLLGLIVVLSVLWWLLSGMTDPLLLGLGAVSVALVTWLAYRMDVVDGESYPLHLRPLRLLAYWAWLAREIASSNVDVLRVVWSRRRPRPAVGWLEAGQRTPAGRTIYGNSITLTPGTVTLDLVDQRLRVHALTAAGLETLRAGEMNRRICAVEGER